MANDKPTNPTAPPGQREEKKDNRNTDFVSKARTIHGLAAELKNEIRADRIRQSDRRKNPL